MCINMFNMLCVFGRIYEYGLYIMHDLSMTWDLWVMIYDACDIIEKYVMKKGFILF